MNTLKKTLDLLTQQEQKKALLLFILILIMALIDVLGVASILPFIGVLSNPELIESNSILAYLYKKSGVFGVNNAEHFLFVLGILVFIILMISLSIRAITNYAQIRFALMREYSIGKRLIEGYLSQPYTWFLNRNSADFGKNILSEVTGVIHQTIIPMINLIAQSAVSIALLTLIIIADPVLALSVGLVLVISYGGIFYFVKMYLSRIGSERLKANKERFIGFSDAFGAIKELKVRGLEEVYIKRFTKPAQVFAINHSLSQAISQLPRYLIEGIAFGGMIILVLFLMNQGSNFTKAVPIIALYAFVGYRLMPALQQIYNAITQIRFSEPALDSLHKDLINLKTYEIQTNSASMPFTKSITLDQINFNYPDSKKISLKNINLFIPALSKVGIVGPTGSGKTTMIDLILGLLEPNQGTFKVDNNIINNKNKRSWQKSIGYVPQQIYLSDNSIASNIAFGVNDKNIDFQAVVEAAKIANLHDFLTKELPDGYDTTIGERGVRLSGGQRQRIGIARALYHKPKILILDEATSALDNVTEKKVMEAIQALKNKITIIIIAHRLSVVKNCDTIFLLDNGKLKTQGTYEELIKKNEEFLKMVTI